MTGFQVGLRESWHELLADIKARGLSVAPKIAVGDGAMGFWNALDTAFPGTKHQRCWVHQAKNVLNCFPKQMAVSVKSDLNDIQHAAALSEAEAALELFTGKYKLKYEKGVKCLTKDSDAMLAFFDFPADHRGHLRTSNPLSRACKHALPADDRKRLQHCASQNSPNQRSAFTKNCKADGFHPYSGGIEKMVAPQR